MEQSLSSAVWADLTETQPFHTLTWLEKQLHRAKFPEHLDWLHRGVVELDFSSDKYFMDLIDQYCEYREKLPMDRSLRTNFYNGWHYPTAYLDCVPMLSLGLYQHLVERINFLLNDAALLHLALTGWVSTERNWHQDSYLNPPEVWSNYVAAWIALDDIDPDSGPFEYVPGSNRWEVLRREKLFQRIPASVTASPEWPSLTQDEVARVCEEKIVEMAVKPVRFLPKKGQVLLWHSNLIHRGTAPRNPDLLRKALILHYSGVTVRRDMEPIKRFGSGFYFEGPTDGSTRMMK